MLPSRRLSAEVPTSSRRSQIRTSTMKDFAIAFAFTFAIALGHAVLLGWPLFLVFRSKGWINVMSCVVSGFAVGALPSRRICGLGGSDINRLLRKTRRYFGRRERFCRSLGEAGGQRWLATRTRR